MKPEEWIWTLASEDRCVRCVKSLVRGKRSLTIDAGRMLSVRLDAGYCPHCRLMLGSLDDLHGKLMGWARAWKRPVGSFTAAGR